MKKWFLALALVAGSVFAQVPQPTPITIGSVELTGSIRVRAEAWEWFEAPGYDDGYAFVGSTLRLGLGQKRSRLDWQIEGAAPALFFLPEDAVAPAPRGQLGFGGSYFAPNDDRNPASLFLKQAFVRFKNVGGEGNSLRLGRFEFIEGMERMPKDPAVAALKRERIPHRLIGNFGFTHVGRSIDGLHFSSDRSVGNLTAMMGFPTQGVFDVNGGHTLDDVSIAYGAFTRPFSDRGEWRLFATRYGDDRGVVKVDNRPAAVRAADREEITIYSVGGHYLHGFTGSLRPTLLMWANWQTGDWGRQDHRASAAAVEAGISPPARWSPSMRAGYFRGSGDSDPADGDHQTFFTMLSTPRVYARFPFFNQMNNEDAFVSLSFRPAARVTARSDFHWLRLSEERDLWYAGGGAFDEATFGFAGRPSGGASGLARLLDLSVDVQVSPTSTLGLYLSRAFGGRVVDNIYPGSGAGLIYVELSKRF